MSLIILNVCSVCYTKEITCQAKKKKKKKKEFAPLRSQFFPLGEDPRFQGSKQKVTKLFFFFKYMNGFYFCGFYRCVNAG